MSTLFLVRHGQASFGADDYDKLSPVGHQQAHLLGRYFADRGVRPVRVMTGTLRRQRETWAGIAAGLATAGIDTPPPLVRNSLDEYDAERILAAQAAAAARAAATAQAVATVRPDQTGAAAATTAGAAPAAPPARAGVHVGVPGDPADPEVRRAHFRLLRQALTDWAEGRLEVADHRTWAAFRSGAEDAFLEAWRGPPAAGAGQDPALPDTRPRAQGDIVIVSSGGPIAAILTALLDMPPSAFVALNLQARNAGYSEFQGNGRRPNLASFNGIAHLDVAEHRHLITFA